MIGGSDPDEVVKKVYRELKPGEIIGKINIVNDQPNCIEIQFEILDKTKVQGE